MKKIINVCLFYVYGTFLCLKQSIFGPILVETEKKCIIVAFCKLQIICNVYFCVFY